MADEIILINVSGQDKPGLMSTLSESLVEQGAQVLDIGQAVIHEDLALGILARVDEAQAAELIKATMLRANEAGSTVRITNISPSDYQAWLEAGGQTRHILTVLAGSQGAAALHAVSARTHEFSVNIDSVRRLTDRAVAQSEVARTHEREAKLCVEMRVRGLSANVAELQNHLFEDADRLGFDFSLQIDSVFRRNRRLVAFDMDSTLITEEVMDELAKRHGVGDQVVAITAEAMAGKIDFQESFRQRARLLKGMPEQVLEEVAQSVKLNAGADRLLRALQHFGYKTAVLSGGFQYVGEHLQRKLGIDHIFANELEIEAGVMTGEVRGEIVDAERKASLLNEIAGREGIMLQQTIAIGDGANDLPMLTHAGLGVAFHAKAVVRETASHAISNFGLDAVLYLIGFSDRDIDEALSH